MKAEELLALKNGDRVIISGPNETIEDMAATIYSVRAKVITLTFDGGGTMFKVNRLTGKVQGTDEYIRSVTARRPLIWSTALHEAGHVLGFRLAGIKIKEATIIPSLSYEGCVFTNEYTKTEDQIVCDCLGHAAELEFGFDKSWGHYRDYEQAAEHLKGQIKWARSKAWALAHGYVYKETTYFTSEEGKQEIRNEAGAPKFLFDRYDFHLYADYRDWRKATRIPKAEWKPAFDRAVRKARRLATKHHAYIQQVAELLMQHGTLTDYQIPQLTLDQGGRYSAQKREQNGSFNTDGTEP